MKRFFVFLILNIAAFSLFSQTPSVVEHIRFPLWAEVDAYPGFFEEASDEADETLQLDSSDLVPKDQALGKALEENKELSIFEQALIEEEKGPADDYSYPISQIKKVAPFFVSGMVYGWDFVYTPSDKTRCVDEYFEVTEKEVLGTDEYRIEYSSVWIEDNKFNCWVDFTRSAYQIQNYYLWSSVKHPVIQGVGYGPLEKGFDGIKQAAEEALKDAVREHYRKLVKNKPKEITGSVLVRKIPTLGIKSGQYIIKLDFFLEYGKIKEYTKF